jgi:hypothetical protein
MIQFKCEVPVPLITIFFLEVFELGAGLQSHLDYYQSHSAVSFCGGQRAQPENSQSRRVIKWTAKIRNQQIYSLHYLILGIEAPDFYCIVYTGTCYRSWFVM